MTMAKHLSRLPSQAIHSVYVPVASSAPIIIIIIRDLNLWCNLACCIRLPADDRQRIRSVHSASKAYEDRSEIQVLSLMGGPRAVWRSRSDLCVWAQVAEQCLGKAKDLSGLLLLHTAKGSAEGMQSLVDTCQAQGRSNVAFLGNFLLGHLDACVDLLISAGRTPEAAFFARTYTPHRISEVCCHDRAPPTPPPPPPHIPKGGNVEREKVLHQCDWRTSATCVVTNCLHCLKGLLHALFVP